MNITKIDSKITGIERFSGGIRENRNVGVLVRLPDGVDLKAMVAAGTVFFIRKPQDETEDHKHEDHQRNAGS